MGGSARPPAVTVGDSEKAARAAQKDQKRTSSSSEPHVLHPATHTRGRERDPQRNGRLRTQWNAWKDHKGLASSWAGSLFLSRQSLHHLSKGNILFLGWQSLPGLPFTS